MSEYNHIAVCWDTFLTERFMFLSIYINACTSERYSARVPLPLPPRSGERLVIHELGGGGLRVVRNRNCTSSYMYDVPVRVEFVSHDYTAIPEA